MFLNQVRFINKAERCFTTVRNRFSTGLKPFIKPAGSVKSSRIFFTAFRTGNKSESASSLNPFVFWHAILSFPEEFSPERINDIPLRNNRLLFKKSKLNAIWLSDFKV